MRRPTELGALIRDRREARGWTQEELAERAGVSRRWVNEFESGKGTAQVRLVFDALNALDVELEVNDADDR
ncbi:helix-turn-helix domain-containing protein [Diaminobutyricibacter sp. McL0618]|uniref:helix-turn-helix domain-containing protein n=1 Tax=Leifsonia sp. McL0618 TaxID=3415677 RepID=UPI003CF375E2